MKGDDIFMVNNSKIQDAKIVGENPKGLKKIIIVAVVVVVAAFLLASAITIVPAGHTGVVVTLGKVNSNVLSEGFHLKHLLFRMLLK